MHVKNVLEVIQRSVFDNEIIYSYKPIVAVFIDKKSVSSIEVLNMLREIAEAHCDKFKFIKVNFDSSKLPDLKYEIFTLPTIIIYKRGLVVDRINKGITYKNIISALENLDEDQIYLN